MKNIKRFFKNNFIFIIVSLLILLSLGYFIRPYFHSFFIFFYMFPVVLQSIFIGFIGFFIAYYYIHKKNIVLSANFSLICFTIFFVIGMFLAPIYTNLDISSEVMGNHNNIDTLPDIDHNNPRILPRIVAEEYAENSLQEPRYKTGTSDVSFINGKPFWMQPLIPDGTLNRFLLKQKGAVFVDMTTVNPDTFYDDTEMTYGEGMLIFDNIYWQLLKEKYFVNYQDSFVFNYDNESFIATPYIDFEIKFKFPIVYTIPRFGGVSITNPEGDIDYVNPDEISSDERLTDQRVYPYSLAHRYVSSTEYRNGLINKWFFHEDQLEVADIPGRGNDQPFVILTEDGPKLFIATEPFGDASGLFEVWIVDGKTGEYNLFSLDKDQGLIGANRAMNYVRRSNSRVNWADRTSDTGFIPIEPLPVIVDDILYWQVRIVPLDSAGIAFTSFVNSEDGTVYSAENDEEIYDFLSGKEINETVVIDEDDDSLDDSFTVKIIDNGEIIEEFEVNKGQRIEIE
ncbi:MAG: hypothetical protein ACOCRX_02150 [Candidatus Woesearchaeota archaeon]